MIRHHFARPSLFHGGVLAATLLTWTLAGSEAQQQPAGNAGTGTSIHVGVTPADSTPAGTYSSPYGTIQAALDRARPGDTILVHPGVYAGDGNVALFIEGREGIAVEGWQGDEPVVIDCAGAEGVTGIRIEGSSSIAIRGITVRGASNSGICVADSTGVTITGCRIFENTGTSGAGIRAANSAITIHDCLISENAAASDGGGIFSLGGTVAIHGCEMIGNAAADGDGGAVCIVQGPEGTTASVVNSIIRTNFADDRGGGVFFGEGAAADILHTIVDRNTSGGIGGGIFLSDRGQKVHACIIRRNVRQQIAAEGANANAVTYCNIEGGYPGGTAIIDAEPMLTGPRRAHLAPGSPCIDAGGTPPESALRDLDGEGRPARKAADIGPDEFIDTDEDQLPDWWENSVGLDPGNADEDEDGESDHLGDFDDDAHPNSDEYLLGSETVREEDWNTPEDMDEDGFWNIDELFDLGSHPALADSDFDGLRDRDDVVPTDHVLCWPRLEELAYIILDLSKLLKLDEELTAHVVPTLLNNAGQMVLRIDADQRSPQWKHVDFAGPNGEAVAEISLANGAKGLEDHQLGPILALGEDGAVFGVAIGPNRATRVFRWTRATGAEPVDDLGQTIDSHPVRLDRAIASVLLDRETVRALNRHGDVIARTNSDWRMTAPEDDALAPLIVPMTEDENISLDHISPRLLSGALNGPIVIGERDGRCTFWVNSRGVWESTEVPELSGRPIQSVNARGEVLSDDSLWRNGRLEEICYLQFSNSEAWAEIFGIALNDFGVIAGIGMEEEFHWDPETKKSARIHRCRPVMAIPMTVPAYNSDFLLYTGDQYWMHAGQYLPEVELHDVEVRAVDWDAVEIRFRATVRDELCTLLGKALERVQLEVDFKPALTIESPGEWVEAPGPFGVLQRTYQVELEETCRAKPGERSMFHHLRLVTSPNAAGNQGWDDFTFVTKDEDAWDRAVPVLELPVFEFDKIPSRMQSNTLNLIKSESEQISLEEVGPGYFLLKGPDRVVGLEITGLYDVPNAEGGFSTRMFYASSEH